MLISLGDNAEPIWLSVEDIVRLNIKIVEETGEDHAILSQSALEGATCRPQNLHYYEGCRDIIELGIRLISGIAKDHCFMQGNKRTALHAGIVFMELNDFFLDLKDSDANAELIEKLVTGDLDEVSLVQEFSKRRM